MRCCSDGDGRSVVAVLSSAVGSGGASPSNPFRGGGGGVGAAAGGVSIGCDGVSGRAFEAGLGGAGGMREDGGGCGGLGGIAGGSRT